MENNALNKFYITRNLNTKFIGKNFIYYDEVSSTNVICSDLAKNAFADGTVVVADSQTEGKGRKEGRIWISPKNENIYISLLLKPEVLTKHISFMNMLASVVVCETLREVSGLDFYIKWPNDILYENKKICGVLIETSTTVDYINYLILGVGINVNQKMFDISIDNSATSLFIEKGDLFSREQLIVCFLEKFEQFYLKYFLKLEFDYLLLKYKLYSCILEKKIIVLDKVPYEAVVVDINDDGSILVKTDQNIQLILYSTDISIKPI